MLYHAIGNADDELDMVARSTPRLMCDLSHAMWHMRLVDSYFALSSAKLV